MKILHIINGLTMGGAENLLVGLAGEQIVRGHDVFVAPLVCPDYTPVREKMESKGVHIIPFSSKGSVYNPYFIIKIARAIRGYDVVHVHLFPALYWAGFAKLLSFTAPPLVYTEHSTNNKRRNNIVLHAVDKFVYQYAYDKIVACSYKALETYTEAYPNVKHVCAINNGVDTNICKEAEPYSKRDLLGIDENSFVVTMVARFMIMKHQDTIVEAISKLPNHFHVVFVGGQENETGLVKVKKMAEVMKITDRVHFLYIRKDVPRILKTSDVIVMASDYEGLSLSSIEGMAAGKPFVATNVNGLREVVEGAGILFENRDANSLAKILCRLDSDKSYYSSIANECAKRALEYDISKTVNNYLSVYQEFIE